MSALIFNNYVLLLLAGVVVALLFITTFYRRSESSELLRAYRKEGFSTRFFEVVDTLKPRKGSDISTNIKNMVVKDGGVIRMDEELMWIFRLISALIFGTFIVLFVLILGLPTFVIPVGIFISALIPGFIISRHNKSRHTKVMKDLPNFVVQLRTYMQSTGVIHEAMQLAVTDEEGPLYDEIRQALSQRHVAIDIYDAIDKIGERNDIELFRDMADKFRTGSQRDPAENLKTIEILTNDIVATQENKIKEKGAKIPNKLMIVMVPFMLPALLLGAAGPAIVSLLSGG